MEPRLSVRSPEWPIIKPNDRLLLVPYLADSGAGRSVEAKVVREFLHGFEDPFAYENYWPNKARVCTVRIDEVDRVLQCVGVQIQAPIEANGILGGPAPSGWIVVARAKADEAGVSILQPAREAKRLEARRGILGDPPEFVVVEPLGDRAVGRVHYQPHAAEVIADEPVGHPALHQVVWHIRPRAVDESAHHLIAAVKLGHRCELALVEEALHPGPVHRLADPAILPVDQIGDLGSVGKCDLREVTQRVAGVAGRPAGVRLPLTRKPGPQKQGPGLRNHVRSTIVSTALVASACYRNRVSMNS